ncbi:hypothetical protein VE02_08181 [Pseudogymnoascus sp. 03VT05]|nr:hypothetical protein VE02_08181 [Pseudogymnoascus sp. 03VT05]
MEANLNEMATASRKGNCDRHSVYIDLCQDTYPDMMMPLIDYSPGGNGLLVVKAPVLGPYDGETRMEVFNRLYCLLKYIQYCLNTRTIWATKFTPAGLSSTVAIQKSHAPYWMQEKDADIPKELPQTAAVEKYDSLPPLNIPISWLRHAAFKEKADLDEALAAATAAGFPIPNTTQISQVDPRLAMTLASFKDGIRRQFNCQQIRVDIWSLVLQYRTEPSEALQTLDVLRTEWDTSKGVVLDDANYDFSMDLILAALDEDDDAMIFESFEVPPAISGFFDTSSGEAKLRGEGAADTEKPSSQETPPGEPIIDGPTTETIDATAAFMEAAFGARKDYDPTGSRPDPLRRFPLPEER